MGGWKAGNGGGDTDQKQGNKDGADGDAADAGFSGRGRIAMGSPTPASGVACGPVFGKESRPAVKNETPGFQS
jgi:hypothetical protein